MSLPSLRVLAVLGILAAANLGSRLRGRGGRRLLGIRGSALCGSLLRCTARLGLNLSLRQGDRANRNHAGQGQSPQLRGGDVDDLATSLVTYADVAVQPFSCFCFHGVRYPRIKLDDGIGAEAQGLGGPVAHVRLPMIKRQQLAPDMFAIAQYNAESASLRGQRGARHQDHPDAQSNDQESLRQPLSICSLHLGAFGPSWGAGGGYRRHHNVAYPPLGEGHAAVGVAFGTGAAWLASAPSLARTPHGGTPAFPSMCAVKRSGTHARVPPKLATRSCCPQRTDDEVTSWSKCLLASNAVHLGAREGRGVGGVRRSCSARVARVKAESRIFLIGSLVTSGLGVVARPNRGHLTAIWLAVRACEHHLLP